jgi:hypothetical protein
MAASFKKSISLFLWLATGFFGYGQSSINAIKAGFLSPPAYVRPGVYWYFMDGNMNKVSITRDLESMKAAGIGNVIFLEVNVGIPVGPVDFLSEQWQYLFKHAVRESERLGITITLGIGPGWTGSGGPWVPPGQSMQDLMSGSIKIVGGKSITIKLPLPAPNHPFFGEGSFTPGLKQQWEDYYKDVAVLAYPTPDSTNKIADIGEKALYYRAPYSSAAGVRQYVPTEAEYPSVPKGAIIKKVSVVDLTGKMQLDGTFKWDAPKGNWTIMRFVSRNNGAVTRPAPITGLGFECDKFDTVALDAHLAHYVGKLLRKIGKPDPKLYGGLKRLHMDSWEMSSQNWTGNFRGEFIKRRGYDPLPFYPVYGGNIVGSLEISERFLWDLRQTANEMVLEYHAGQVKKYAHKNGLYLSIEPYDMNPSADLELGAVADFVMCEFWSKGYGFNSTFSCIEATSVAHVKGTAVIPAEAFTAGNDESWKQYPGSMKNQGDWAFASGINSFVFHTFQNQYLADTLRPGMTMGPYGVHWDRNQTWWPLVGGYHRYISKCSFVLQQGKPVADILYLTPEGAPHVFRPPYSALMGNDTLPDRKGYNFDGCAPTQLLKASVKNGLVVFPSGASYRILVLPMVKTMTLALLAKVISLTEAGATVIGSPPLKSPGLSGYPDCDAQIQKMDSTLWGTNTSESQEIIRACGKGKVIFGGRWDKDTDDLYPKYALTAELLKSMDIPEDFVADKPIRYSHRTAADYDIYFVSNTTADEQNATATFRSAKGAPELWDPITGETRKLPQFTARGSETTIPLQFVAWQSYFIVFNKNSTLKPASNQQNFPKFKELSTLKGPWQVSFDPKWGGPKNITFDKLTDWSQNTNEGIKYYSGFATYYKDFISPTRLTTTKGRIYLDFGDIKDLAKVKLNGKDLGIIWTAPYRVDITSTLQPGQNHLEVQVVNRWVNRLVGDQKLPDDGIKNDKWPDWLLKGQPRPSKRYTFTTYNPYKQDSPLLASGLIGPVTIQQAPK